MPANKLIDECVHIPMVTLILNVESHSIIARHELSERVNVPFLSRFLRLRLLCRTLQMHKQDYERWYIYRSERHYFSNCCIRHSFVSAPLSITRNARKKKFQECENHLNESFRYSAIARRTRHGSGWISMEDTSISDEWMAAEEILNE